MTTTLNASNSGSGGLVATADASGVLALQTAGTTAVTIDASQRVLINKTSTDGGYLNVQNGSTTTRAYLNATLRNSRPAGTNYSVVSWNGSFVADAWIGQTPGSDALCFGHDAGATITESMRLLTNGMFLVNSTSDVGTNNPAFSVNGGSFSNIMEARWTGTSSIYHLLVRNGNGLIGGVQSSGSTTAFLTSSDYRLKNNIAPMTGALAKVAALKPVTYKWKADNTDGEGFIAHELAAVCPIAVHGEKDEIDADGNIKSQSIDTSFLVATLTAAIQEQQALITSLTARIAALEGTPA